MQREEALNILGIEEEQARDEDNNLETNLDYNEVMERFDLLMEKNQLEKGGSFYI